MAHITTIGAGLYTTLAYSDSATSELPTAVATSGYTSVVNVREFPEFGAPANIVNVPVYGAAQSSQIQGQADAPTLEFTLNYIPSEHRAIQNLVGDGAVYAIRIRLLNSTLEDTETPLVPVAADEFNDFYILGSFAAFTITPNLTDTNQATLTIATQGDFTQPLTIA